MVALIIKKYNKRLPGFNSNSLPLQKEVNDDKELVMENLENARPLQDCRICNERLNEFEEFFNSQKKNLPENSYGSAWNNGTDGYKCLRCNLSFENFGESLKHSLYYHYDMIETVLERNTPNQS